MGSVFLICLKKQLNFGYNSSMIGLTTRFYNVYDKFVESLVLSWISALLVGCHAQNKYSCSRPAAQKVYLPQRWRKV